MMRRLARIVRIGLAGLRRWRAASALVILITLGFGAWTALAQTVVPTTPNPLPGSQFQGADGNQLDGAAEAPPLPGLIDWQGLERDGRVEHTSDPNEHDNVFGGPGGAAPKENNPGGWFFSTSEGGAKPDSDNILDVYRVVDRTKTFTDTGEPVCQGAPNDECTFLYLAATRFAQTGTTYLTFELNQVAALWNNGRADIPCRTDGDILITFQQSGNEMRVAIEKWVTDPGAFEHVPALGADCAKAGRLEPFGSLAAGQNVQGATNGLVAITTTDNYLPGYFKDRNQSIPQRQFLEAAINLTKVFGGLNEGCRVFGSTWAHSRASLEPNSDMKDYVAPEPFHISTCATPTLRTSASGSIIGTARTHRLRRHSVLTPSLTINDTAILQGGDNPTGTLTFRLYGPNDATCTGTPVVDKQMDVEGNGAYQLPSFTPEVAGVYRWVVAYSGDDLNEGVSTRCGDDTETIVIAKARPHLTTSVSCATPARSSCNAGEQIKDAATLSGGFNPTGTITFKLYGPGNRRCRGTPIDTSTASVNGNGTYPSERFTVNRAGTYRLVAIYSGDHSNRPRSTACGDPTETIKIAKARPTLTTTVTPGAIDFGSPISDTATLDDGVHPTGTIIFRVYGPDNAICSGRPAHIVSVRVDGNGDYTATFTPTAVGTYRWVATYTGDGLNAPTTTKCGDPGEEQVVAHPVVPTSLSTRVVASSALPTAGSAIRDIATLSAGSQPPGRPAPTGTIVFTVYGPNNTSCGGPATATSTATVTGSGTYTSGTFSPIEAGEYRWVAIYLGDDLHLPAKTACGDEPITVTRARPSISTSATPSVTLPGSMQDAATLSGGVNPAGTILFEAFGPDNSACSGPPAFSAELNVAGNGVYRSPSFGPRAAGTYYWRVTYSGDDNNNPVVTGCGGPGETTEVLRHTPSLTTSASPPARLHRSARRVRAAGLEIHDSATLTGFRPTGEITFHLYGPDDATCSHAIFTTATVVNGNGIYNSEEFTPELSGTYRWTATYSGDGNNNPVGPTDCADPNEAVHVTVPAHPSLITSASEAVALGGAIHDTATLTGGSDPTGTITFALYSPSDAPNDGACSGTPIFTSTVDVHGNGDYTSGSYLPGAAGAYLWVAKYSGDHANHPAATACRDAGEIGVVRPPDIHAVTPGLSTTTSPSPGVGAGMYDTAHLNGGVDPGGAITFRLFGPGDTTCSGPPVFTTVTAVDGNGDYRSAPFTVLPLGTYRWVASYAGDAMNNPVDTGCGDPAETVTISATVSPDLPDGPNVPAPPRPSKPKPKPPPPPKPIVTG